MEGGERNSWSDTDAGGNSYRGGDSHRELFSDSWKEALIHSMEGHFLLPLVIRLTV